MNFWKMVAADLVSWVGFGSIAAALVVLHLKLRRWRDSTKR